MFTRKTNYPMRFLIIGIFIFISSCSGKKKSTFSETIISEKDNRVDNSVLKSLVDSFDVNGSILIYDSKQAVYYSNDFEWAETGNLPASTFKIPNSIIGIETGIIANDSTVFIWDGEERWSKQWEKDLPFREAFHLSCVPCYQELARKIGVQRMNNWIEKFDYGRISVDQNTIDNFWLTGNSRISQMEQISFLKRYYNSDLPISKRTENITKHLMIVDQTDEYVLSGKTGLSNENNQYNGWFVGYLELKQNTFFFATNIEPKDVDGQYGFNNKRKEITLNALEEITQIRIN